MARPSEQSAPGTDATSSGKSLHTLATLREACPENVTPTRKELRLSDAEFERVFGMGKPAFAKMPKWKQTRAKKSAGLF